MITTENRVELLTEMFHRELEFNKSYSRTELGDLMEGKLDYNYNVTALTYNRWNKGMGYTCPLFEHTDRGTYRYLGPDFPYNGPLSYFLPGLYDVFVLGRWSDGKLYLTNPDIKSSRELEITDCAS